MLATAGVSVPASPMTPLPPAPAVDPDAGKKGKKKKKKKVHAIVGTVDFTVILVKTEGSSGDLMS